MSFTQLYKILFTNQRFATRVNIYMSSKLFSLFNDGIYLIKTKVLIITIFCSPTTLAMQITGARWVKQNCPENIALVFVAIFFLLWPSHQISVNYKSFQKSVTYLWISVVKNVHNKLKPMVFIVNCITK